MNNPFEEYGVTSKSIQELIEEFVSDLMLSHQVKVRRINFDEQGLRKLESEMKSKKIPIVPAVHYEPVTVIKTYTSAGRLNLGSEE